MQLTVHLGPRSYPIIIGRNCASALPAKLLFMFPKSRFGLVTNTTLARIYKKQIAQWKKRLSLTVHVMPDGEQYKTVDTWSRVLDTFLKAKFERSSVIVAFGGGVAGDVAGFAAAAMLRGVAHVQVPTTLLAIVDSSVGGKTGLDHPCGKNLVGAFHQPGLVWIDTAFLTTLSRRQYLAGLAELFKYGLLGGRGMFDFVSRNSRKLLGRNSQVLLEGIKKSIAIKARIVEQDEHETDGLRMLLNLGHTFGHALEKVTGFKNLLHGEAVWWGMACAIELGKILKTIPASDMAAYDALLAAMPRPKLPVAPSASDLYKAMLFDKKVAGGKIRFVVPARAGTSVVKSGVREEVVKSVIAICFSNNLDLCADA
jgi:3-dehydroquinate synthase